jgi:hypothetical protein
MLFAFRVLLYLLALNLSFNGTILALPLASASIPNPLQLSDEETVRTLTEKYGLAITAGDLEAMRQFWNPIAQSGCAPQGLSANVFVFTD